MNPVNVIIICVSIVILAGIKHDNQTTNAAISNGLQQCVIQQGIGVYKIWQKECKQ